jgi:peptidyl-prolyl cis-trans isomerase C
MSRFRPWLVVVLAIALAVVVFCVVRTDPPLATLGNQAIREADFQQYLAKALPPERVEEVDRDPAQRKGALEEYLDALAVAEKARREGIDQEPRFKKAVELMEMKALAHLVTERHRTSILRDSAVSAEEVNRYYEQHKGEFTEQPRFTAHHLLVYVKGNPAFPEKGRLDAQARAKAAAALARLRAGKNWDEVARSYSDDGATNQRGGLIRDGQFGYYAPEVERAVRTQELGKPGEVVRTEFGYHVLQVESRITENTPQPFEQVKEIVTDRLTRQRSTEARKNFMTPLWLEVGFKLTEAGKRDVPLLDESAVAPDEILAEVGGKPVSEADFRWFLKDALMPRQRTSAYSRPDARQGMLSSYLDMLVLRAKAKKAGLDKTPEFARSRLRMTEQLLVEFVQQRDMLGPLHQRGTTDEERRRAQREALDRVRTEVGLKPGPGRKKHRAER